MATRKEIIISKAIEILELNPKGVRYSELVRKIKEELPAIRVNTIHGTVWNLQTRVPKKVYKPARGLFRHVAFREKEIETISSGIEKAKEEDFYKPFADWLINELEECTRAIPLGGHKFKDKWGTPDVMGKREPRRRDILKLPTEITSAEIKTDARDLITAFGQACSYKLFSHKCYIVVPKNSPEDDKSKLDALCLIFGIGLVFFDNSDVNNPNFEIRVRPLKHDPDMFYVNKYLKLVERELFR